MSVKRTAHLPITAQVIGNVEAYAIRRLQELRYKVRVTWRDGHPYICTRDYKSMRVNLHVYQGRVTNANFG